MCVCVFVYNGDVVCRIVCVYACMRIADHSEPVFVCTHLKHMYSRVPFFIEATITCAHTETTQVNRNVLYTVCSNNKRKLRTTTFYTTYVGSLTWECVVLRFVIVISFDCIWYFEHPVPLNGSLFLRWSELVSISLSSTLIQPHTSTHTYTLTIASRNLIARIHVHNVCTAYKLLMLYKYYHSICSLELLCAHSAAQQTRSRNFDFTVEINTTATLRIQLCETTLCTHKSELERMRVLPCEWQKSNEMKWKEKKWNEIWWNAFIVYDKR